MKRYDTMDIIHTRNEGYEDAVRISYIDLRDESVHRPVEEMSSSPKTTKGVCNTPLRNLITLVFCLAIIILNMAIGTSPLQAQFYSSFYSDHKSFSVGDILTVNIAETSKASSSSHSRTGRSQDHSMNIDPGVGRLSFIPLAGMSGSSENNFKGDANTSRDASLTTRMTVRIVDIDTNGNLIIEGSNELVVNGENQLTTLQGIVRPQDVSANNTIQSYNIADAKISYTGSGAINEGSRVGFISRVLNWLF